MVSSIYALVSSTESIHRVMLLDMYMQRLILPQSAKQGRIYVAIDPHFTRTMMPLWWEQLEMQNPKLKSQSSRSSRKVCPLIPPVCYTSNMCIAHNFVGGMLADWPNTLLWMCGWVLTPPYIITVYLLCLWMSAQANYIETSIHQFTAFFNVGYLRYVDHLLRAIKW